MFFLLLILYYISVFIYSSWLLFSVEVHRCNVWISPVWDKWSCFSYWNTVGPYKANPAQTGERGVQAVCQDEIKDELLLTFKYKLLHIYCTFCLTDKDIPALWTNWVILTANFKPHLTLKIPTQILSCLSSNWSHAITNNCLFSIHQTANQPNQTLIFCFCWSWKFWKFFFLVFVFRLPFQTLSNEQILSTETVLESSKTWRQQYNWHSPPQQTSCKNNVIFILPYMGK